LSHACNLPVSVSKVSNVSNVVPMTLTCPEFGFGSALGLYVSSSYQPCKFKLGKCSDQNYTSESFMKNYRLSVLITVHLCMNVNHRKQIHKQSVYVK
jgi:hypothetical protein